MTTVLNIHGPVTINVFSDQTGPSSPPSPPPEYHTTWILGVDGYQKWCTFKSAFRFSEVEAVVELVGQAYADGVNLAHMRPRNKAISNWRRRCQIGATLPVKTREQLASLVRAWDCKYPAEVLDRILRFYH